MKPSEQYFGPASRVRMGGVSSETITQPASAQGARRAPGDSGHPEHAPKEKPAPLAFRSILSERVDDPIRDNPGEPFYFRDLNLDQIVEAITSGRGQYDLKPFFHRPLRAVDEISYRQEVMRDLESSAVAGALKAFAASMQSMRDAVEKAGKRYYKYQKERVFLQAMQIYCTAVAGLQEALGDCVILSRGLLAFRSHLEEYATGPGFVELHATTAALTADLAAVRYNVRVFGGGFRVQRHEAETNYGAEIEALFSKFQQEEGKDRRTPFNDFADMNHIEAKILDFVAMLHPQEFARLSAFCVMYQDGVDPILSRFDREMQFYLSYLDYITAFEGAGLSFCHPAVSKSKAVASVDGFDLALATKLLRTNGTVVRNDFELHGEERIFVVSGPNQGGKTTFARTFGQLHHLASLGLPVPGREARLFLFDAIHTHFEREESAANLRGKLQDDLVRIHDILGRTTPDGIVIMNEIFSSTTLQDASFLARQVVERIMAIDALCVVVTFLDELSTLSEKTVSAVSTVVPDDPAQRTFKVVRRPADGRAYALSIAEKYGLTYAALSGRLHF